MTGFSIKASTKDKRRWIHGYLRLHLQSSGQRLGKAVSRDSELSEHQGRTNLEDKETTENPP